MKKLILYSSLLLASFCHAQSYVPEKHQPKMKVQPVVPVKAYSFNLQDVQLLDGPFKTAMEADVRYPSDAALSLDGARTLARQARKLTALIGADAGRVRDRSRALGRRLRSISRTMVRRTGERKAQVLALTEQAGELPSRSLREARRLAFVARSRARGRADAALRADCARLSSILGPLVGIALPGSVMIATEIIAALINKAEKNLLERLLRIGFDPERRRMVSLRFMR